MSKKNRDSRIVFSTDPDFEYENGEEIAETLPPGKQQLLISLDRKQRKGKQVTLVKGFVGNDEDLKALGKTIRSKCGTGGSDKSGEIIIQGDFRQKIQQILTTLGYRCKVSG